MACGISSLNLRRVNFDRSPLWARRLSVHAQANARLSGKCCDIGSTLFLHITCKSRSRYAPYLHGRGAEDLA